MQEIRFLNDKIEEIELSLSEKRKDEYIYISEKIFDTIKNYNSREKELSEVEIFILDQINKSDDRSKITCRNLAAQFTNQTENVIHKSQINNIMRNNLGLHYIKTSIKTKKILTKENTLFSFCFIKIILRALKLGFKLLFLDESCILCSNNHYRCWRYQ